MPGCSHVEERDRNAMEGLSQGLGQKGRRPGSVFGFPWPGHIAPAWASHTQAVPNIYEDSSCPELSAVSL